MVTKCVPGVLNYTFGVFEDFEQRMYVTRNKLRHKKKLYRLRYFWTWINIFNMFFIYETDKIRRIMVYNIYLFFCIFSDLDYLRLCRTMNYEVDVPGFHANNTKQDTAIMKALNSRFSLIQGPPGRILLHKII